MSQSRWFYWLLIVMFFWFIFGGWGFIWWIFPFFWLLPWLFAAQDWGDWNTSETEDTRKKQYEPDWVLEDRRLEEPEYLERADGERLQIIDDDGAPPPRLTIG
jgi:hypothetical protein